MEEESRSSNFNFPSGVQLPFALRRKAQEQQQDQARTKDNEDKYEFMTAVKIPEYSADVTLSEDLLDSTFSSEELERRIWKATVAMVEVQKQVHRGEETYYDETQHGNIFKGWEGFLDAKDVGNQDGSGGRRVPADFRWFSSSCKSVSRNARPSPLTVNPLSTTVASTVASQQPRTNTNTPVPKSTVSKTTSKAAAVPGSAPAAPAPVADATASGTVDKPPAAARVPDVSAAPTPASAIENNSDDSAEDNAGTTASSSSTPSDPTPNEEAAGTKRPADSFLQQKIPKKQKKGESADTTTKEESKYSQLDTVANPGTAVDDEKDNSQSQAPAPIPESQPKKSTEPISTGKKQRGRKRKSVTES